MCALRHFRLGDRALDFRARAGASATLFRCQRTTDRSIGEGIRRRRLGSMSGAWALGNAGCSWLRVSALRHLPMGRFGRAPLIRGPTDSGRHRKTLFKHQFEMWGSGL